MKLTVCNVAKELNVHPMKLAWEIRNGVYEFAKAYKKNKNSAKHTYFFDYVKTMKYIHEYKEAVEIYEKEKN
ncbi:hypothetical protein STFE110948_06995 [Streptobacillus felis]|uniref:hypothetical protein n=1 Tax=Streptobacillus felis TaxID=1384509 RepID=UPI00082AE039|nr:hypothetical protein [Streptobacillus felis]